jgi:hypothetical protein
MKLGPAYCPLVAARVQRALEFLNVELNEFSEAGYGPETK